VRGSIGAAVALLTLAISPQFALAARGMLSEELSGQPIPPGRSFWSHNDSAVYLAASGSQRSFYYQKPNWKLEDATKQKPFGA